MFLLLFVEEGVTERKGSVETLNTSQGDLFYSPFFQSRIDSTLDNSEFFFPTDDVTRELPPEAHLTDDEKLARNYVFTSNMSLENRSPSRLQSPTSRCV